VSEAPLRCQWFGHKWGMWFGGVWHNAPLWLAGRSAPFVCKRCPARGRMKYMTGRKPWIREVE
jgi:hypothetical protein